MDAKSSIPAAEDFGMAFSIIAFASDPVACDGRLKELAEKSAEARGLIEQVAQASADLDEKGQQHVARLKAESEDHANRLENERAAFDADHARREKVLKAREAEIDRLHDAATADAEAAANVKADLMRRATSIREIARQTAAAVN